MRALAMLSMHTSPLARPGAGDGGGMNVYVRELAAALARVGVQCDVFTRATDPREPATVVVEPGFRVHHVPAGPMAEVPKHDLPALVDEFADGVETYIAGGFAPDLIHANYWLSAAAGHALKHRLDLPLVSTFHTLDRVKAEVDASDDSDRRAFEEARTIGCSDAVLASCDEEAAQLVRLYDADPTRIEVAAPGVDHAFFAPGNRCQARRALDLPCDRPVIAFVGRIQPLKGAGIAVEALALLESAPSALLCIVGGPSGPQGDAELARLHVLADSLGIADRVRFVPPQPHELLSTWYRAADAVVVPSRSESFGLVALEAAACGTPVVAAAVGGLPSLVIHGRTGFLVDDRDPRAYAEFLGEILHHPALAQSLSRGAAERARRYTWREGALGLRNLYERLTERQLVECR